MIHWFCTSAVGRSKTREFPTHEFCDRVGTQGHFKDGIFAWIDLNSGWLIHPNLWKNFPMGFDTDETKMKPSILEVKSKYHLSTIWVTNTDKLSKSFCMDLFVASKSTVTTPRVLYKDDGVRPRLGTWNLRLFHSVAHWGPPACFLNFFDTFGCFQK